MTALQEFKQDLSLILEAGLIAIKQGDEESAKKLFNAIGVIDPKTTSKQMGYGLISLHKMDIKNAIKQFEEVLKMDAQNYRAEAFLGLAHILSVFQETTSNEDKLKSLKKGAELAHNVLQKSQEPSTRQLAESLLQLERELQEKGSKKI